MNKEQENTPTPKERGWLKWLLILPMIGLAIYFGKDYIPTDFDVAPSFTEYGELSKDTIALHLPDVLDVDSLQNVLATDSVGLADTNPLSDSLQIDTFALQMKADSSKSGRISPVNTVAEAVPTAPKSIPFLAGKSSDNAPIIEPTRKALVLKTTLFDDLFFANQPLDTLRQQQFFSQRFLSAKAVLKILALTGKDILLNGNSTDARDIMESMVAEAAISGIVLCDEQGTVAYASNAKFANDNILNILPDLDLKTSLIAWGGDEKQTVVAVPIFHTFGKIGTAVLLVKN